MPNPGFEVREVEIPFLSLLRSVLGGSETVSAKKGSVLINKNPRSFRGWIRGKLRQYFVKTGAFHGCRFPDLTDLWVGKAFESVSTENWDLVVSTACPYTVHRVAAKLRKNNCAKKWIADWRDLWIENHIYPGLPLFRNLESRWERSWMCLADRIITVSEPLAEILRSKHGPKVDVVYNGFDPEDLVDLPAETAFPPDSVFRILYTGTIYEGKQNPSPLFEAIKQLHEQQELEPNQLQIIFCGNNADVSELAKQFGVEDYVQYLGFLPRPQVLQMQQSVDALLFLEFEAPGVDGILTGKLFEYLFSIPPILAVGVSENTSVGRLILQANRGFVLGNNVDHIAKQLLHWLAHGPSIMGARNKAVIDTFSRELQAKKVLGLVDLSV